MKDEYIKELEEAIAFFETVVDNYKDRPDCDEIVSKFKFAIHVMQNEILRYDLFTRDVERRRPK